jgi:hypothetical protein
MKKSRLVTGTGMCIAALLCSSEVSQSGSTDQRTVPRAEGPPAGAETLVAMREQVPEVISATIDSSTIAAGVRRALGEPSRFNWQSVVLTSLDTSGGSVKAEVTKVGDNKVSARVHGDNIFTITATGHGDRNTPLNVSLTLNELNAQISFANGQTEVEATARIVGRGGCRVWTRAWHAGATFRLTAEPQAFDLQIKVRLRINIGNDGTTVLTPLSWAPTSREEKIDVKMIGQKLPGGWARINPLDAATMRVEFGMPKEIGDRTVDNPLRAAFDKVIGRDFVIGKLSL